MASITNVREVGRGRLKVYVDGLPSFTMCRSDLLHTGIKVGHKLSDDELAKIRQNAIFQECVNAALHFLSYRPRSEMEVRKKLQQRGFVIEVIDQVVDRLKQQKIIDDKAFAKFWTENRRSFRPKSRAMLKLELRRKGIENQIVEKETLNLDDNIGAYEAASKLIWKLKSLEQGEFYRRLTGHLRRRGFDYDVIKEVVGKLWSEQSTNSS
jgi:regulatory protein